MAFPAVAAADDDQATGVLPPVGLDPQLSAAFERMEQEEDALPSPEDTAFFDFADDSQPEFSMEQPRRKKRKVKVGSIILILVIVLIIAAAAGCVAGYLMGYGFPTQESVAEEFVTSAASGDAQGWVDDISESEVANVEAMMEGASNAEVIGIERSTNNSTAYLSATTADGGTVYYQLEMKRSGISWAVESADLYFPSTH